MDVDSKVHHDPYDEKRDSDRDRDREYDRDRDRDRERDSHRDRDRDRDRERDRARRDKARSSRRSDHWEPEERRRRRSRSRSRSASPRRRSRRSRSYSPSRSRSRSRDRKGGAGGDNSFARSLGGPMNAPHEEAVEFSKVSKRENRVYVGNLSYDVKYRDLMEFMRGAGEVLFAEVLVTPTGVSKGCGIVEFTSQEDAQRSIRELSEATLLGRPVFIREDRENEARFGAAPVPGKIGAAMAGAGLHSAPPPRPFHHNSYGGGGGGGAGNQLYVGNLPYEAEWQDLKDLFRSSGNIIRADIQYAPDGRSKGSGIVVFETSKDAQKAISMYNSYEWYGRVLEVREDRYAGSSGPGSAPRGLRGGLRGLRGGGGLRGLRGGGLRGGLRGGHAGGGGGREFSDQNLYADYDGPNSGTPTAPGQMRMDGYGGAGTGAGAGGYGHGGYGGAGYVEPEPSQQIMVRNLPWSTANEDLVDLFETTGTVELAEILFDGTRSKGCGVVQFAQVAEADTAIAKFQQYVYGGRPLDVRFNDRWHTFTPTAAKGGQVAPIQTDA